MAPTPELPEGPPSEAPVEAPGRLARALSASGLLLWLAIAALAFAKLPRGFPLGSRFLVHDLLPWLIALACGAGLLGLVGLLRLVSLVQERRRAVIARGVLEGLAALSLAAAAGVALTFPESRPLLQGLLAGLGLVTLVASAPLFRASMPWAAHGAALGIGALLGLFVPLALRAPDPSTRPLGLRGGPPLELPAEAAQEEVGLAPEGALELDEPGWWLRIDPFFTIESRSPDRGWTSLAPLTTRHRTVWSMRSRRGDGSTSSTFWRSADGLGQVLWRRDGELRLDAAFRLDETVFTHLATWSRVRFFGERARVRFSPCGETEIEVHPSDYPEGRPARFAYLGADGRFVVAEASSGEKGPFRTLCEGPLGRDEALGITLLHARGQVRIELLDFASQASVEPSPTAGWGVPQNAIQLMRESSTDDGPIQLHMSLAATGIGRGWDTVGLAAGTYSNRMRVRIEQ